MKRGEGRGESFVFTSNKNPVRDRRSIVSIDIGISSRLLHIHESRNQIVSFQKIFVKTAKLLASVLTVQTIATWE
jgi:hypothetical protein